jgi:hypothetical protein
MEAGSGWSGAEVMLSSLTVASELYVSQFRAIQNQQYHNKEDLQG